MKDLKNLKYLELSKIIKSFNKPEYLAKNIYTWVYKRSIIDFNLMSDISKEIRSFFINNYKISFLKILELEKSKDGTVKFLFELDDGNSIETVLIPHESRLTVCISSQVGCKMNCSFCSTSKQGFTRNLSAGEIVNQVHSANQYAKDVLKFKTDDSGYRCISNIVYMGMGEPLDNVENVIKSIEILTNDNSFGFGSRKITVSTCGVLDVFKKYYPSLNSKLAISLNAANDEFRNKIMPINKKYNINTLIEGIKSLKLKNHDFITIEYILFQGLNDSSNDASSLAKLLKNLPVKVNLLYYNKSAYNDGFTSVSDDVIFNFNKILNSNGIVSRVRESRGADISAACGQLKSKLEKGI